MDVGLIQAKHEAFMNQMRQKLEDKVMSFIRKKEEEVCNLYTMHIISSLYSILLV